MLAAFWGHNSGLYVILNTAADLTKKHILIGRMKMSGHDI